MLRSVMGAWLLSTAVGAMASVTVTDDRNVTVTLQNPPQRIVTLLPSLTETVCERLGTSPGSCELRKFANGETSVGIRCSVRDQDVFVVQSGSSK